MLPAGEGDFSCESWLAAGEGDSAGMVFLELVFLELVFLAAGVLVGFLADLMADLLAGVFLVPAVVFLACAFGRRMRGGKEI